MSSSHKLSTAIKALIYLAKVFPAAKTSSEIAEEIGVNASKLRLILSQLQKNEIVGSAKGPTGGFFLIQDFTSLSMYEIYNALEEKKILDLDVADASSARDDEVHSYNRFFNNLYADIQKQVEIRMQSVKLEDIKGADKNEI